MSAEHPSGWVYKSDTKVSKWDKRWMVLDGFTLNSYKKQSDKKPKKVFNLTQISGDMLDYGIGSGAPPPTEHHLCVKTHTRMLNLAFENSADREAWFARFDALKEELFPSGPTAEEIAAKEKAEADAKAKAEAEAKAKAEAEAKAKAEAARKAAIAKAERAADAVPFEYAQQFNEAPFGLGLLAPRSGVGQPLVEAVREGTPAQTCGTIIKGDKLLYVDEVNTADTKYDDVLKYMKKAGKKVKKNPVTMRFSRQCAPFVNAGKGRGAKACGHIVRIRYVNDAAPFVCTLKTGRVSEFVEASNEHKVVFDDASEGMFNLDERGHHLFDPAVMTANDSDSDE